MVFFFLIVYDHTTKGKYTYIYIHYNEEFQKELFYICRCPNG